MVLVATQVKRRRGTNNENDAFAGAEGEITVDLTNKELRVHDGSGKKGGFRVGHYSYSSNCITEIPQDIKLELNNGTLTLKAGSKVYVPNGAGVFDTITIASDLTISSSGSNSGTMYLFVKQDGTVFYSEWNQESGTGTPIGTWTTYYNTNDNKVYRYTTSTTTPSYQASLPIAKITVSGGAITSIDQVFNGFGYIGSTVFALPGVRGLIPNGRNADGSLNNILTTPATTVKTSTAVSGNTGRKTMTITSSGVIERSGGLEYNERENRNYNFGSRSGQYACGHFTVGSDYKITNFVVKTAFHAVDYNDTEYIAHQAMPSDRYVDLTLGASWSRYTAPADGYICLRKSGNAGEYIKILNRTQDIGSVGVAAGSGFDTPVTVPVSKGDVVQIAFNVSGATNYFRFVYANGSK